MICLKLLAIICFAYLLFLVMGRVANYNKNDTQSNIASVIDNVTIVILVLLVYFLKSKM